MGEDRLVGVCPICHGFVDECTACAEDADDGAYYERDQYEPEPFVDVFVLEGVG